MTDNVDAASEVASKLKDEVKASLEAKGSDKEHERVVAISNYMGKGHDALILECLKDKTCSVESAVSKLNDAIVAKAESDVAEAGVKADAKVMKDISAVAKPVEEESGVDEALKAKFTDGSGTFHESAMNAWLKAKNEGRIKRLDPSLEGK